MKVRAVVFDISGTVMDHGSRAPVRAFVELFARRGVAITEAEARAPMGLHKLDHVRAILADPAVAARWLAATGLEAGPEAVTELYASFPEIQRQAIRRHLDLLPGVAGVCSELRRQGIRIASTTGFESNMLAGIVAAAAAQGYEPECWVCPDQCGGGRPAPWMIYHAARQLGVYPLSTFVKVGDTPADIAEARNAGTWAVAVTRTGNEIGLSQEEWESLPAGEQTARLGAARKRFEELGAHYVIESVADLTPVIEEISRRLDGGERP